MTRRAAILGLLLIGFLAGCSAIPRRGVFAYIDEYGRTAVYDLASRRVIWHSDHSGPQSISPAWSSNGDLLAFVFTDPSDGDACLGYVELNGMTIKEVDLNEPAEFLINPGGDLSWSPSGSFVMLGTSGYPASTFLIIDIQKGAVIRRSVAWGKVLWSPEGDRICYPALHGGTRSPDARYDLVVVDLASGRSDIVFTGEPGYVISPFKWTDSITFGHGIPGGQLVI